jgi:hypothetical protein
LGEVEVYRYNNSTNAWSQLGNNIAATVPGTLFGTDISIEATGARISFGAPNDPTNGINSGSFGFYEKGTSASWIKLSLNQSGIDGELIGASTAVSSDGSTVAIGATGFNVQAGRVDIYQVSGWKLIGQLFGSNDNDQFGTWLHLLVRLISHQLFQLFYYRRSSGSLREWTTSRSRSK